MKKLLILLLFISFGELQAQDNCNAFLYAGDTCQYKACDYLANARGYFQLRREYHETKDRAIEICPQYSTAYKQKSTAYLKTGDFLTWKKLMDKAVALNPSQHLDYRGWCRFQFFRDYRGAIEDFDRLAEFRGDDLGYSQNGFYHLDIAKALCLKMLGKREEAIELMEKRINLAPSKVGFYDYLHLGVLYLETGNLEKAMTAFEQQTEVNEFAENLYYKSLCFEKIENRAAQILNLKMAIELYSDSKIMNDPYTHQVDKVFLSEIKTALARAESN